jgi:hypothetical protein
MTASDGDTRSGVGDYPKFLLIRRRATWLGAVLIVSGAAGVAFQSGTDREVQIIPLVMGVWGLVTFWWLLAWLVRRSVSSS